MSASRYSAAALLNALFSKTSSFGALASPPAALYVCLLTAAPSDTSTGSTITETTYTGYTRVNATADWGSAVAGSPTTIANNAVINFPACTGGTSTVTYFAICDAASNGNLIAYGSLASSLAVSTGITPSFAIGGLSLTLA